MNESWEACAEKSRDPEDAGSVDSCEQAQYEMRIGLDGDDGCVDTDKPAFIVRRSVKSSTFLCHSPQMVENPTEDLNDAKSRRTTLGKINAASSLSGNHPLESDAQGSLLDFASSSDSRYQKSSTCPTIVAPPGIPLPTNTASTSGRPSEAYPQVATSADEPDLRYSSSTSHHVNPSNNKTAHDTIPGESMDDAFSPFFSVQWQLESQLYGDLMSPVSNQRSRKAFNSPSIDVRKVRSSPNMDVLGELPVFSAQKPQPSSPSSAGGLHHTRSYTSSGDSHTVTESNGDSGTTGRSTLMKKSSGSTIQRQLASQSSGEFSPVSPNLRIRRTASMISNSTRLNEPVHVRLPDRSNSKISLDSTPPSTSFYYGDTPSCSFYPDKAMRNSFLLPSCSYSPATCSPLNSQSEILRQWSDTCSVNNESMKLESNYGAFFMDKSEACWRKEGKQEEGEEEERSKNQAQQCCEGKKEIPKNDNQSPTNTALSPIMSATTKQSSDECEEDDYTEEIADNNIKTTLMLRNLPNKYTRDMLLEEIAEKGLLGDLDFFYLPIDLRHKCNVGYCFLNIADPANVQRFKDTFHNGKLEQVKSGKTCVVSDAKLQGLAVNIESYRNSAVMNMAEKYHPLIFKNGEREAFPPPTMTREELKAFKPAKMGVSARRLNRAAEKEKDVDDESAQPA